MQVFKILELLYYCLHSLNVFHRLEGTIHTENYFLFFENTKKLEEYR